LSETIDGVQVFEGRPQQHKQTLETMFHGFAEKKDEQLPCLKEIRMSCHWSADEALKARCESLRAEVESVGVEAHIHANRWTQAMDYAGRSP